MDKTFHPERLTSERSRLGLSVEKLAALVGISPGLQKELEAGTHRRSPVGYEDCLERQGVCIPYVYGNAERPGEYPEPIYHDADFQAAVALLRRAQQAVEAFVGKEAAVQSPELIAAVMNATLIERWGLGVGHLETFVDRIADAIESAGEAISEGLSPKP